MGCGVQIGPVSIGTDGVDVGGSWGLGVEAGNFQAGIGAKPSGGDFNTLDYLTGEVADKQNDLEERSNALEAEINTFQDYAQTVSSRYIKESYLYRDNADFKFVVTNADLKYLKYIYPEKAEEYQAKIDQLNSDIKAFEQEYGDGIFGANDILGDYLGGIVTGIAMAIGNVIGFVQGKDISFEDALKSAIALVVLVLTVMYAPESTAEVIGAFGLEVTMTEFYIIMTVLVTLSIDATFGGSKGLIEVLNVFGEMFDKLGLTDGSNVFNKFFDSFKKDSDYNGYLVFAVQMLLAYYMMPNFETMMGANYAKIYQGYSALNNVKGIIDARDEYEKEKEEYETKLADMQKKAIQTERDARLAKLSIAYREGNDIVSGNWFNPKEWFAYKPNGIFYGVKDSPYDIMFQYDLSMLTQPTVRKLGVIYEW